MVRMDSHHLKLYSEYWTTLLGDGEGRVFGFGRAVVRGLGVSVVRWGRRKADFSTPLRSGRNDGV